VPDIAAHPLVTRGVLVDWYSYAQRNSISVSVFKNQVIPISQIQQVAREQGVSFRQGDVLLIRTGWLAHYNMLSTEEQDKLGGRDDRASCGVEASKGSIKWHWEQGFAAVASDTVAYEAWPSTKPWGVSMHEVCEPSTTITQCSPLDRYFSVAGGCRLVNVSILKT
jgi:kynurenine formamidase